MINLLCISAFLLLGFCFPQPEKNLPVSPPQLVQWGIKPNEYFSEMRHPKKRFERLLSYRVVSEMPNQVRTFKYQPKEDQASALFDCENTVFRLRDDFEQWCKTEKKENTDSNFVSFWQSRLRACHIRYKKTTPTLFFTFENIKLNKYWLDSVGVLLHAATSSLSLNNGYYSNVDVGKVNLVIDPKIVNKRQFFRLQPFYIIDDAAFTLEVQLLNETFWSGSFDKQTMILDILFLFKDVDGKQAHVRSELFVIDV